MAVQRQSRSRKLRTHIFKLRQSKATQKYGDALSFQILPPVAYFLQHLLVLPKQPTPGDQVLKFLCPLPVYSSSHANARREKGCGVPILLRSFWGLVFILREGTDSSEDIGSWVLCIHKDGPPVSQGGHLFSPSLCIPLSNSQLHGRMRGYGTRLHPAHSHS